MTQKGNGMICLAAMARQKKFLEDVSLDRFVATFAAENDNSWMSANFELLVVDASFSCYNDSVFPCRIPHYVCILGAPHSVFAHVFEVKRRRTIPQRLG